MLFYSGYWQSLLFSFKHIDDNRDNSYNKILCKYLINFQNHISSRTSDKARTL